MGMEFFMYDGGWGMEDVRYVSFLSLYLVLINSHRLRGKSC